MVSKELALASPPCMRCATRVLLQNSAACPCAPSRRLPISSIVSPLAGQRHFERQEECNTRETKHFRPRRPCVGGARILHYREPENMASFPARPPPPSRRGRG